MLVELGSEAIRRFGDVSGGDGSSAREVLTQGVYRVDSVILLSRARIWVRDHEVGGVCLGVEEKGKKKKKKKRGRNKKERKKRQRKAPAKKRGTNGDL